MTAQKLTHSSTKIATKFFIILLIMISIINTSHLGSAYKTTPVCSNGVHNYTQQRAAAIDAVALSVYEVQEIRSFANRIPRLNTLLTTHPTSKLVDCLADFMTSSYAIKKTLYGLRRFKAVDFVWDARPLKNMTDNALMLGAKCRRPLSDIDGVFASLFARKLDAVGLLIDDLVSRITILQHGWTNIPPSNQ